VPLSRNFKVPRVKARPRLKPRAKNEERPADQPEQSPAAQQPSVPGIPPALAGLLVKLPPEGQGWMKDNKDRFMTAFTAFIDLFYPIQEEEPDEFEDDI
jgi:hypothetical protein